MPKATTRRSSCITLEFLFTEHRDEVRHAGVEPGLREKGRHLSSVVRLMVEQVRDGPP